MKSILKYGLMLIFCASLLPMHAQKRVITEIVELNDGTVLEGYTSRQSSSQGIEFTSFAATIELPAELVSSARPTSRKLENVSAEWKEWFEANEPTIDKDADINFYNIYLETEADTVATKKHLVIWRELKKYNLDNVRILTHGTIAGTYYKFIDLGCRVYNFKWSEIKWFTYKEQDPLQIGGINISISMGDSYQTYVGKIVKQIVGKSLTLKTSDGESHDLQDKNIVQMDYIAASPDQPIWEQTPLLDVVAIKSGNEIRGLITQKNYREKDKYYYSILTKDNNNPTLVLRSDVKETRYEINPEFKPLMDIRIPEDSIVVNACDTAFVAFEDVEESCWMYFLSDEKKNHRVVKKEELKDGVLCVQSGKNVDLSNLLAFRVERNEPDKQIKKSYEKSQNNKSFKIKSDGKLWLKMCDPINGTIVPTIKPVTAKGNRTLCLEIEDAGIYILYQKANKRAIIIEIE